MRSRILGEAWQPRERRGGEGGHTPPPPPLLPLLSFSSFSLSLVVGVVGVCVSLSILSLSLSFLPFLCFLLFIYFLFFSFSLLFSPLLFFFFSSPSMSCRALYIAVCCVFFWTYFPLFIFFCFGVWLRVTFVIVVIDIFISSGSFLIRLYCVSSL